MSISRVSTRNSSAALLEIIGIPNRLSERKASRNFNLTTSPETLYSLACKNKIGLLFLQAFLRSFSYESFDHLLDKEFNSYTHLIQTAQRASSILERTKVRYAVIKSVMPFPAVPNDVDIVIFDDMESYRRSLEALKNNYFEPLGESAPLEDCLHDTTRGGRHLDPAVKDPFDVDIYREIGASHIIYMNKNKLERYCTNKTVDNRYSFSVLEKPAEMAVYMFHSIFPERIYTLLLHYYILYTIEEMNQSQTDEFVSICVENRITRAVLNCLRITENIQKQYFGQCEDKITRLRQRFGPKKQFEIFCLPFKYPLSMIMDSFWNKKTDLVFTKSVLNQVFHLIKSREIRNHVINEYIHRKNRETY